MVNLIDTVPGRVTVKRDKTVRINGVAIARAAIAQETQNHTAASPAQAWSDAAQALAIRELLLQEARRLGLEAVSETDGEGRRETEEEALIRTLVAHAVTVPEPTDEECRRVFEASPQPFRTPALYEVRHILLPLPKDVDKEAVTAQAHDLMAQMKAVPGCFPALARAHSKCPSKEFGGSLGQIGPGQTVPEFEAALAALPTGLIGEALIESRYGLHIVRLDRRIEGRALPFEMVRTQIAAWLSQRVYQTAIRQYISLLAGRAEVEGVDLAASSSPLLQ